MDGARAFFTVGKAKADALGYDGQKDYFRYYVEARIENCAGNYLIAIDLLNEGIQAVLGFDLMEAHFRREIISPLFSIGDFKEAEKQRARANAVYELYDAPLLLIPPWPGLEKAAP